MTISPRISRRSLFGLVGAGAGTAILAACGDDGSGGGGTNTSAIDWWHIQNTEPMLPVWADLAKQYQTAHSGTEVKITPLENEAFKARLTTVTQAGTPPDLFQSWGGGVLKQQVDAGLVKDITADVSSWVDTISPTSLKPYQLDGKIYGMPFDFGMVGFWYNKALFVKAGVTAPPTTWAELLEDVKMLKAAKITPVALAGQAKWPGHFYWSYLAMRVAGADALSQANDAKNFDQPEFVQAGRLLKQLVDLVPFQRGFLAAAYDTPDGQAATMGNGQAAMELMGQWGPSVQKAQSGKGIGDDLAFFPFPMVEGGAGKATDVFGGGNGFAVGKDAPPETLEFLKFILNVENQRRSAATGAVTPVTKGAEDGLADPNLKIVVETLGKASGFQLYLDQAFAPAVGTQVNDSVAELIAGKSSPEQVVKTITQIARR